MNWKVHVVRVKTKVISGRADMPLIKQKDRERIDPALNKLITKINDVPQLSYVLLKILCDTMRRGNVTDVIMTLGVIQDVKLLFEKYRYINLEERILFERWLDGNGEWKDAD